MQDIGAARRQAATDASRAVTASMLGGLSMEQPQLATPVTNAAPEQDHEEEESAEAEPVTPVAACSKFVTLSRLGRDLYAVGHTAEALAVLKNALQCSPARPKPMLQAKIR
eukprot:COSAG01_NODE_20577_length_947_cov_1.172170_2_plen_110_part_01